MILKRLEKYCFICLLLVFLGGSLFCYAQQEEETVDVSLVREGREEGKISLDLKGVDIGELLKILSLKMNVNIVPTKEVTGRVNVFLNDITFQDALDIILITNDLAAVQEKNIITVMTTGTYSSLYGKRYHETRKVRTISLENASPAAISEALGQLKTDVGKIIVDEATATIILVDIPEALDFMEKTVRLLDQPQAVDIFELKYAKVEDIKEQLSDVLTPGTSKVQLDTRTNKIAVSDLPERMKTIKKMITAFDEGTRQVLIEAQIVQVSLNDRTQAGISWEKIFRSIQELDLKGAFSSGLASKVGQFSIGVLEQDDFNLVIQALNTFAKTNILSRPRIAVLNNEEASILIGAKEVYFSQTQSQSQVTTTTAESVNYVDVGVKLNVTPTISSDDFVTLKIRPEVSSVRETAESPLGSQVPVVETSEAETVVKVKNRAMILIGGLMKEERRKTQFSVPILSKIPFIGAMFRDDDVQILKTELAIFLTPTIITGDVERVDAEGELIKAQGVLSKQPKDRMD